MRLVGRRGSDHRSSSRKGMLVVLVCGFCLGPSDGFDGVDPPGHILVTDLVEFLRPDWLGKIAVHAGGVGASYSLICTFRVPTVANPATVAAHTNQRRHLGDLLTRCSPRDGDNFPCWCPVRSPRTAEPMDQTPLLQQISVPTLIVVGDQDQYTPVSTLASRRTGSRARNSQSSKDAGHVPNLEPPAAVNVKLAKFLVQVVGNVDSAVSPLSSVGEPASARVSA